MPSFFHLCRSIWPHLHDEAARPRVHSVLLDEVEEILARPSQLASKSAKGILRHREFPSLVSLVHRKESLPRITTPIIPIVTGPACCRTLITGTRLGLPSTACRPVSTSAPPPALEGLRRRLSWLDGSLCNRCTDLAAPRGRRALRRSGSSAGRAELDPLGGARVVAVRRSCR